MLNPFDSPGFSMASLTAANSGTRHAETSSISAQIRLGAGAAAAARLADADGMSFGHAGIARKA